MPMRFFAVGRPHARVDAGVAHFRRLRSTRVGERAKALAYVELVWELVHALELHVEFPPPDLSNLPRSTSTDPVGTAQAVRRDWEIAPGPLPHLCETRFRIKAQGSSLPQIDRLQAQSLRHARHSECFQ